MDFLACCVFDLIDEAEGAEVADKNARGAGRHADAVKEIVGFLVRHAAPTGHVLRFAADHGLAGAAPGCGDFSELRLGCMSGYAVVVGHVRPPLPGDAIELERATAPLPFAETELGALHVQHLVTLLESGDDDVLLRIIRPPEFGVGPRFVEIQHEFLSSRQIDLFGGEHLLCRSAGQRFHGVLHGQFRRLVGGIAQGDFEPEFFLS